MSTLLDNSERVAGLIISKRVSASIFNPEQFAYPYNEIVKKIKSKEKPEDIYLTYTEAYDTAVMAAEGINGSHEGIDWTDILNKSYVAENAGKKLSKVSHDLLNGKNVSLSTIRSILTDLGNEKTGRKSLIDIPPSEIPFIETGWEALDEHLGGIPSVGLIVVSAYPSAGKTSWVIKLAKSFAIKHKDKNIGFYSLEMIDSEISLRFKEIGNSGKYQERIKINCDPLDIYGVINDAAQIDNLGLVIIDFVDLLVKGESTESSVGAIYRECATTAKELGCPIVLLAQYSYRYQGGIPRPEHIRYTSLARALGWMLICLWNPHTNMLADDPEALKGLPMRSKVKTKSGVTHEAAAIFWKSRGGFRKHPFESPGAIIHQFKGDKGWSPTGKWRHIQHYTF